MVIVPVLRPERLDVIFVDFGKLSFFEKLTLPPFLLKTLLFNLFNSFKGSYIEGLAWLNTVLENHFGIVDMPIIDAQNKSDIRSSMITELLL